MYFLGASNIHSEVIFQVSVSVSAIFHSFHCNMSKNSKNLKDITVVHMCGVHCC